MELLVYMCFWTNPSIILQDLAGPKRQKASLMIAIDRKVVALSQFARTGDDTEIRQILNQVHSVRKQDESRLEAKSHTIKSFEWIVRRELQEGVRNPDAFESHVRTLNSARKWATYYRVIVQAKHREEKALEVVFHVVKFVRDLNKAAAKR